MENDNTTKSEDSVPVDKKQDNEEDNKNIITDEEQDETSSVNKDLPTSEGDEGHGDASHHEHKHHAEKHESTESQHGKEEKHHEHVHHHTEEHEDGVRLHSVRSSHNPEEHKTTEVHHKEHETRHKPEGNANLWNVIIILGIIVGIVLIINLFVTSKSINKLSEKITEAKDSAKPVDITLLVIKDDKCTDCFDISQIIEAIKKENVNIKSEETAILGSENAKELIEKYSITRIPAMIVKGDTSKLEFLKSAFVLKDDAFIFNNAIPPYSDKDGNIKGRIAVTKIIDSSCKICSSVEPLIAQLKQNSIAIATEKEYDISSTDGKALLNKYSIKKVPTIILSSDAGEYEIIKNAWPQIGVIAADGSYVMGSVSPPYRDIASNDIMGLVEMTYLTDKACVKCYNVSEHRTIIANPRGFNVYLSNETYVDISEPAGKEIITQYNITQVPTILISKEASYYQGLISAWAQVGSVEKDGTLVFRQVAVMQGTYKDLVKNEIVNATIQN